MARKVGVLLSGCGFMDGAEIHEAVLTLLALDQKGVAYTCCAPNIPQAGVMNHATHEPARETRNVLHEAARIARGDIRDVTKMNAAEFDALLIPGGFGAAKNLCNFAEKGADCTVDPGVERLIGDFLKAKKPIGAICIAPGLLAKVCQKHGVSAKLTIGSDAGTAKALTTLGCVHENHPTTEIAVDTTHKIVSTPAYMLGPGPAAVWEGIRKLVDKVVELA